MATRSRIGLMLEDGTIKHSYCHFDGYPHGVGHTLVGHYSDIQKVEELLSFGDMSFLSPKVKADLRDLAKVMVKEGFTKVDIAGHTDSTGQAVSYDNQQLSDARAKATLTYLKRFVPKLKSVTGAYAYERRITDDSTTEALYINRRAEVAVS